MIELTHKLSICGHITHDTAPRDQWGRDIGPPQIGPADTFVIYLHYNPEFRVLENETRLHTEKDGSFRITDLAPGTYYLDGDASPATWFPGSRSFSGAKPIVVGNTPPATCNTDILSPNYAGGYAVGPTSISVEGGDPSQRYKAALLETNAEGVSFFGSLSTAYLDKPLSAGSTVDGIYVPAGKFEAVLFDESHFAKNVWAGAPTQRVIFDSQTVTLETAMKAPSQNVVVFKPHTMASIQGDVVLENVNRDDFCPGCRAVSVSILREGDGEYQTVNLSQGNHFDFHNVTPGDYQLFVSTTRPDKVFLKSIVAAGQTSQGRRFTVTEAKSVPSRLP